MLSGGNPAVVVPIHSLILSAQVNALHLGLSPLAESARALAQVGADNRLALNPVCQGVFAVLDDGFRGFIAIVGGS